MEEDTFFSLVLLISIVSTFWYHEFHSRLMILNSRLGFPPGEHLAISGDILFRVSQERYY